MDIIIYWDRNEIGGNYPDIIFIIFINYYTFSCIFISIIFGGKLVILPERERQFILKGFMKKYFVNPIIFVECRGSSDCEINLRALIFNNLVGI